MKKYWIGIFGQVRAQQKRFVRDKMALFFTFLFPLIFLLVFGSVLVMIRPVLILQLSTIRRQNLPKVSLKMPKKIRRIRFSKLKTLKI